MNHKNTNLAIAAIIAVVAMTAARFALPQQALAYHSHHHHKSYNVDFSQNITQETIVVTPFV